MRLSDINKLSNSKRGIYNRIYEDENGNIYKGQSDGSISIITQSELNLQSSLRLINTEQNSSALALNIQITALKAEIAALEESKQDLLESATNIKTINGNSILGSGDLTVGGSFSGTMDDIDDGVDYVKTENNYTDAEKAVVGNTSGTNTGDQDLSGKLDVPTGTPDGTKYLRDDNTWQPVSGGSGLTQPQVMARNLGA